MQIRKRKKKNINPPVGHLWTCCTLLLYTIAVSVVHGSVSEDMKENIPKDCCGIPVSFQRRQVWNYELVSWCFMTTHEWHFQRTGGYVRYFFNTLLISPVTDMALLVPPCSKSLATDGMWEELYSILQQLGEPLDTVFKPALEQPLQEMAAKQQEYTTTPCNCLPRSISTAPTLALFTQVPASSISATSECIAWQQWPMKSSHPTYYPMPHFLICETAKLFVSFGCWFWDIITRAIN